MNIKFKNVTVVGATGRIGRDIVEILDERKFPLQNLKVISSASSAGSRVIYGSHNLNTTSLENHNFNDDDLVFFATDDPISKVYAPKAAAAGAIVIDNSSYFRMYDDVPLIVPEVNGKILKNFKSGIIANPNCCSIPLAILLNSFSNLAGFKIKKVSTATYQSVSGAGTAGMNELLAQTKEKFGFESKDEKKDSVFEHQIAFNCIPKIGELRIDGYTSEEWKIMNEPLKILNNHTMKISATCVRVPVFVGHAQVVNIEFEGSDELDYNEVYEIIDSNPHINLYGNDNLEIITSIDVIKEEYSFVNRLRIDKSVKRGITLWLAGDNLYKGGSLNAVQIAELLFS